MGYFTLEDDNQVLPSGRTLGEIKQSSRYVQANNITDQFLSGLHSATETVELIFTAIYEERK